MERPQGTFLRVQLIEWSLDSPEYVFMISSGLLPFYTACTAVKRTLLVKLSQLLQMILDKQKSVHFTVAQTEVISMYSFMIQL